MKNHNLVEDFNPQEIIVEHRPVRDQAGQPVEELHNVWITLNNPDELNAYTTTMIKEIILALREASNDRAAVTVVLTGAGTRAFCAGGNTREYAEVYAGAPENTGNTCAYSTTWSPPFCNATSPWFAESTACA